MVTAVNVLLWQKNKPDLKLKSKRTKNKTLMNLIVFNNVDGKVMFLNV